MYSKIRKTSKSNCECIDSAVSIGEVRRKKKQGNRGKGKHERSRKKRSSKNTGQQYEKESSSSCKEERSEAKKSWQKLKERFSNRRNEKQVETVILYSRESRDLKKPEQANFKIGARRTMSSLEVRYASVSFLKHITFSSAEAFEPFFEPLPSESSLALKDPMSIETLFKGKTYLKHYLPI